MLQNHLPILPVIIGSEDDLINLARRIAIMKVAQELLANHALILHSAYNIFTNQVQTLVQMSSCIRNPELASHRWLLSQLFKYHMEYACKVKKNKTWNKIVQKKQRYRSLVSCPPPAE